MPGINKFFAMYELFAMYREWQEEMAKEISGRQSQECLEKVAKTVSFLAQREGSFLLLLTGEVRKDRALELLSVRPFYFVYLCGVKT
ncbi:N(6)-adenine-specific DNA methyltransferase 2 [Hordeum vulgare]|nr:N(6)-adenine-specific DNA methyltransferase 2 [Hordeum vulgare]